MSVPLNANRHRVSIHPNNSPSGSKFSALTFPQINFVIARQNAFLLPQTLKLNGTFVLKDNTNAKPVNLPSAVASPNNGSTINNRVGLASCIDEVTIQTLNGRNLETVRNYNRYLASSKPFMNNSFDYNNGLNLNDPFLGSKSVATCRAANVETNFSIPIEVGMLGDMPLNISSKGFHGIQLNILLAQNAAVSQPFALYDFDGNKTEVLSTTNYSYELQNVFLTFDLVKPSAEFFNRLPSSGLLGFNTIQSMHSTILASDTTVNLRLGCRNAISVTHTLIPSSEVNNRGNDSFRLSGPEAPAGTKKDIRTVQYMRAGELFPYNFVLDSEKEGIDKNPQSMIAEPALNSVTLYENQHSSLNPMSNVGINNQKAFAGAKQEVGLPYPMALDPDSAFILGVPMDSEKQGANFKDREYAIRIQSGLDDTTANSLFTFVRCRNVAEYSPTGVNVVE